MATIHKTAHIAASPMKVWERIAAVGELNKILPAVVKCRLDGDTRYCTMADGGQLEEQILAVDQELMRVAYAITKSPFPMERHFSSMQVIPNGSHSRFEWFTDIKPDSLRNAISPMLDQMLSLLVGELAAD